MSPAVENRVKQITLVLGGARSGKSHYAQRLAHAYNRVTFVATARPNDSEMRKKIAAHQKERPSSWRTVEAPLNLHKVIASASLESDVLLIDCLTLYVANVLGSKRARNGACPGEELCAALRASDASVIVVSNEVGSGIVPEYRSGRVFRDLLGRVNQQVAEVADRVVLMVAGLPLVVKDCSPGNGTVR